MSPRLTRPLVLEQEVRQPDGSGGYTGSWEALGTLWAEVRPGSSAQATTHTASPPVRPPDSECSK